MGRLLILVFICINIYAYADAQMNTTADGMDGSGDTSPVTTTTDMVSNTGATSSPGVAVTTTTDMVSNTGATSSPGVAANTTDGMADETNTTSTPGVVASTTDGMADETNTTSTPGVVETEKPDPCDDNECPKNSKCVPSGNMYECPCNSGYIEEGSTCVQGCTAEEKNVNNDVVHQDIPNEAACTNSSLSERNNATIYVSFNQTGVGTTVTANVTCTVSCSESNGVSRAIGFATCEQGGTFSTPTWNDCGETSPTTQQILNNAIIDTSDPDDISSATVTSTVVTMQTISSEPNITSETADDFMAVTNNLLRANNEGAQHEVEDSSQEITDSVNNMAQHVELVEDPGKTYEKYESSQSDIALGVVGPVEAATRAYIADQVFYYSMTGTDYDNLVDANATIGTTKPDSNQPFMSTTPPSGSNARFTFVIYTNVQALFSINGVNILSKNIVYGVNGSTAADISYNMRFPLSSNITVGNENRYDNNKQLDCIRYSYSTRSWMSANCNGYSASNSLATCTCKGAGQYAIRSVDIVVNNDDLSGGAIAGIVIGSLAGVAIIGGLAYYFVNKNKEEKAISIDNYESNEL